MKGKITSKAKYYVFNKSKVPAVKGIRQFVRVEDSKRRDKKISLKVSETERVVLERLAKLHNKSISNVIREALQSFLSSHDPIELESGDIHKDQLRMFD